MKTGLSLHNVGGSAELPGFYRFCQRIISDAGGSDGEPASLMAPFRIVALLESATEVVNTTYVNY